MRLKSIELTANIAWSPAAQHPVYLATGTAAHQLDATFSTVSSINVYRLDLSDRSSSMPLVGSVKTDERYNQLVWGGYGMESGDQPSGVVVTAGDHGNLCVWDAAQLITNTDEASSQDPCIERKDEHTAAVNALDFNAFQPNLLASGGADSEIYIWDLEKMDSPMSPGSKSQLGDHQAQPPEDVLCLAWNRKVQHILASTFSNRCVVWDLRKNEPIIKVSDGMSRMKCKNVVWHPGVATQMCLSSEDDHTPFIQLWDLRFATSPVQSMEHHSKGILAMAWCPRDPNILLSCAKDNQLICWNPNAALTGGEIIYQAQLPSQWVFDVTWCPRNPGLIAASSFDGHVSLYSLMGGTSRPERTRRAVSESFGESDDPFGQVPQPPPSQDSALHMGSLRKAPAWMRPSCGARFAFGGKLITWSDNAGNAVGSSSSETGQEQAKLYISQVITEPDLISRAQSLDAVVQGGKFEEFCTMKTENCDGEIEKDVWRFMKTSFASDARNRYRELLGYSKEEDVVASTIEMLKKEERVSSPDANAEEDADAVAFDSVGTREPLNQSLKCLQINPVAVVDSDDDDGEYDEPSTENALAMALITGRLEEAVELCLLNGRHGEALILAVSGGATLYRRAQERVLRSLASDAQNEKSAAVARLIRAVVARDWSSVTDLCGGRNWRAALACVLTYATAEELAPLCERIGAILEASGDAETALHACLCYICAGSADRLVKCWMRFHAGGVDSSPLALQSVVDKVVVLQHSLKTAGVAPAGDGAGSPGTPGPAASAQLGRYAALLAGQGMLDVALHYLGDSQDENLLLLRDQIYQGMVTPPAGIPVPPTLFSQGVPASATPTVPSTKRMFGQQPTTMGAMHARQPVPQVPGSTPVHSMSRNLGQPSGVPSGVPSGYSNNVTPAAPMGPTYPTANATPTIFTPVSNNTAAPPPSGQVPRISGMTNSSVLRTGRSASAGWNDPPPLKERAKPTEPERSVPPPVNNYYNPAAYLPDPAASAPPPSRYPGPSVLSGPAPPPGPGGYNAYNNSIVGPTSTPQPMTYAPPNYYTPAAPTPPPDSASRVSNNAQPPPPAPAQTQPKAPLPAEHQAVEVVLNELLNLCKMGATSRQMKMKMDDVGRKLEALYDCIRQDSISPSVLLGVHNIVAAIRGADYNMAIAIINQIVETANFAEIRSFLPGLKVLMQSAAMMQIRVS